MRAMFATMTLRPLTLLLLLAILAVGTYGLTRNRRASLPDPPRPQGELPPMPDRPRMIMHAGGEVGGRRYTNSRSALELHYGNGARYFELDMIRTSDQRPSYNMIGSSIRNCMRPAAPRPSGSTTDISQALDCKPCHSSVLSLGSKHILEPTL